MQWTCPSLLGRSLEITLTVPLINTYPKIHVFMSIVKKIIFQIDRDFFVQRSKLMRRVFQDQGLLVVLRVLD